MIMIVSHHSELELTHGICLFNKELTMAKNNSTTTNTARCEHKWVFQETNKKTHITGYQNKTAHFHRIDVYYCEKCCEIKEVEKRESVNLPFGGIHIVQKYTPDWY